MEISINSQLPQGTGGDHDGPRRENVLVGLVRATVRACKAAKDYETACSKLVDLLDVIGDDQEAMTELRRGKEEVRDFFEKRNSPQPSTPLEGFFSPQQIRGLMQAVPGAKRFTARQTAMIGFALCRMAGVVPRNKKSISEVFHGLTGFSANTLGQYLCTSYRDEEIEEVARMVEADMPEFAEYLREKTFFLPDVRK